MDSGRRLLGLLTKEINDFTGWRFLLLLIWIIEQRSQHWLCSMRKTFQDWFNLASFQPFGIPDEAVTSSRKIQYGLSQIWNWAEKSFKNMRFCREEINGHLGSPEFEFSNPLSIRMKGKHLKYSNPKLMPTLYAKYRDGRWPFDFVSRYLNTKST